MAVGLDEVQILPSAARTATPAAVLVQCAGWQNVEVILDLTAFVTAASLTVTIDVFDPGSGAFRTALTGAVIAASGTSFMRLGPDVPNVANVSQAGLIGRLVRITVTHGNANSQTYSVGARLQ